MSHEKMVKLIDFFDVPVLHVIAIGITFSSVENALKIISLILAIGYTLWKWRDEYKKKNEKTTNHKRTTK